MKGYFMGPSPLKNPMDTSHRDTSPYRNISHKHHPGPRREGNARALRERFTKESAGFKGGCIVAIISAPFFGIILLWIIAAFGALYLMHIAYFFGAIAGVCLLIFLTASRIHRHYKNTHYHPVGKESEKSEE